MSYAHPHRYAWGNFAIDADERAHPHTSVPEPPVKNDQVVQRGDSAGSEYGRIAPLYGKIDPTQKSKLINYDYRPYEQQIDDAVAEHGYSVYYAGGKYGRPDLENKNYNTGHLMVYDPTPGQGGDFDDEAQTRSWRKIHELSHALAYKQLNEKYGEGRRIGKLGVHRTLREAKRAVEWEWLALMKQRELSERMGYKIDEREFAREINCLDAETEALTQRGWIKGFELRLDDVLLTKNAETDCLEWQQLTDLRLFPDYEGPIVEFKSKSFHAITTPEHRWLVTTNQGRVRERTSSTLVLKGDQVHRTGYYEGPEHSALTGDQAELLGWFVTDGHFHASKPGAKRFACLSQSERGNPKKCRRIDALLRRLDKKGEVRRSKKNKISGQRVWRLGETLTRLMEKYAPTRALTVQALLPLGAYALRRLREAMILGDGSVNKRNKNQVSLVTGRAEQADAFQALLTLTESSSYLCWRDTSSYEPKKYASMQNIPKSKGHYCVGVHRRKYTKPENEHKSMYHARVPVWCPVVPNTFFVARRSGQVFITGNTVMHDAVHRAITGKFTNPDEEGFIPSDQIVPLEVSLGYLEQAARAMGLKGEDDTLKKRGEYWVQVFEESADPDEPFDAATIDQVEDAVVESLDEVVDIAEEHGMAAGNLYPPSTGTWFHTDPWEDEEGVERQRDMMVARPDGAHLDESDHEELDHRITGATQVSDSFAVSLLRPLVDVGSEGHLYVAVREELASILDKVPNLSPEESKIVSAVRTVGSFVEGAGKRFGEFVIRADEDDEEDLVERVKRALTPDLRKGRWKTLADDCDPMTGHCYVASEALRTLLGPEWRPMFIEHEGSPHWFLKHEDGRILDVTSSQFSTPVPYDKAKGKGFLTREPSARARTVLERVRRAQFDGSEIIPEPKRKKVPLDELLQSEVDRDLSAYEDSGEGLQNIVRVLSLATPAEIEYWSEWYPMAKKNVEHLATEYGLPFDVTAAVVAVLSPGNKWGLNLRAAAEVIENSTRTNAYPRNIEKARQILATEDVSLLTGPKVKTFFQSLVDPESVARDVVLDGHAMNIWRGEKRSLKGLSRPTKAEREAMLRDYARAAEVFGLTPQAVQAITWYIWKSVTKTARSRHKHDKFKGEVYYGYVAGRDGDITHFASGYATKPIQLKPNAKVIRCADNMSLEDALVTAAQQSADAVRFGKAMYVLNKDAAVEPAKGLDWALVEVLC